MTKTFRKNITVYAGSADNLSQEYLDGAWKLGETLAKQGRRIYYGAGKTGLMGALADSALASGGEVIGLINDGLNLPHLVHSGLSGMETVLDIHARQARLNELADAMIALPGGFGTFAELFEALTWEQIGLHSKPIGILNLSGYFDPTIAMIDNAIDKHFVYAEHRRFFFVSEHPEELLEMLDNFTPHQGVNRWMERP